MTDPRPDFVEALKEADDRLKQRAPSADLRARIVHGAPPRRDRTVVALALAVTFCAGVLFASVYLVNKQPAATQPAKSMAFVPIACDPPAAVPDSQTDLRYRGGCTLSVERWGMVLAVHDDSVLRLEADAVRVVEGRVTFEVESRHHKPPVRVAVSGGTIEVIGTRFTVKERRSHGDVALFEGKIAFTQNDGTRKMLSPGERLSWGEVAGVVPDEPRQEAEVEAEAPTVEPTKDPVRPTVVRRPARRLERKTTRAENEKKPEAGDATSPPTGDAASRPTGDVGLVIGQVTKLRQAGEYDKARQILQSELRRYWPDEVKDVLSYELGVLLAHTIKDHEAACRHWKRHAKSFPDSRYAGEVQKAVTACQH